MRALTPSGAREPDGPMVHIVSKVSRDKPVILGVHADKSAAISHADQLARSKWAKDEPEYDEIPQAMEMAIAKKHGVPYSDMDYQEPPKKWHERQRHEHAPSHWESDTSKSPAEGNYGYGLRTAEGFQHHPGIHKDMQNADMKIPYPGYEKAMKHWGGEDSGAPHVHSMPITGNLPSGGSPPADTVPDLDFSF
jgi:hypothetical protein